MQIGELRTLLTVERNETLRAPSGQVTDNWKKVCQLRAKIEGQSGSEGPRGQRIEANYTHQVTTRYVDGLNSKMRLTFNGRVFAVVSVNNLGEKNRWLVWLCNEVV